MTADHPDDGRLLAEYARALADDLADDLDGALDIEAGLSEILLQSRHAALTDDVAPALDVGAGLTDVLLAPAPALAPDPATNPATNPERAAPPEYAAADDDPDQTDHSIRMSVRSEPQVALGTRALVLAQRLADEAGDVRGSALDCVDLLVGVLEFGCELAVGERRLCLVLKLAQDRVLEVSWSPGHRLSADPGLARLLQEAQEAGRSAGYGSERGFLYDDFNLAKLTDLALDLGYASGLDHALAERAARTLGAVRLHRARRQFPSRLSHLTDGEMARFLDDFTDADLRTVDLRRADLIGLRWSGTGLRWTGTGTRWPPGFDLADLRSRSDESPPGSGIYVVRGDTATVPGYVDP